jgi:hypothetical protein
LVSRSLLRERLTNPVPVTGRESPVGVFAVVGGTTIEEALIDGLKARRIVVTVAPVADYAAGVQMVRERRAATLFGDRPVLLDGAKRGAAGELIVIKRAFRRVLRSSADPFQDF